MQFGDGRDEEVVARVVEIGVDNCDEE